ncbi:putative dual specificity protein phosphatase 16 [Mollisia scopiformis]|uniref:protein-tyrosine-phosphatase n=1 Tax=Mollisia scopiformis TaxID=149040 RepID=A0A194XGD5_MOLSC|nr:putative dual specificity protein phosphatase 16 [Mollisia scopiformis]KUJ19199.1 putative dual specificity protein phosphatase 16 [Mollisia scopiformis]
MCTHKHPEDATRTYLHIALDDIDDMKRHIQELVAFIDSAIKGGGIVLVHCALGLNRSAAAILSYLCSQKPITSLEALEYLKERKPDVRQVLLLCFMGIDLLTLNERPSALFLQQINQYYGRKEKNEAEDPMARFHRRLQERKAGISSQSPSPATT